MGFVPINDLAYCEKLLEVSQVPVDDRILLGDSE